MAECYLRNPLPNAPRVLIEDAIVVMADTERFKARFVQVYRAWPGTGDTATLSSQLFDSAGKNSHRGEDGRRWRSPPRYSPCRWRSTCLSTRRSERSSLGHSCPMWRGR